MFELSHNPREWSRPAAYALCEASTLAYRNDDEAPGILISDDETDTQARIFPGHASTVLAFRGTESLRDGRTDIQATRGTWQGFAVHEGFLVAYLAIRQKIENAVAMFTSDGQRLHITGHSLGGALATLAALDLISAGAVRVGSVITFGAPRVFGLRGARWADRILGGRLWRVINSNDLVPRIPKLFRRHVELFGRRSRYPWCPTWRPFRHCGRRVLLTEAGETIVDPDGSEILYERLIGWRADMARDHTLSAYAGAI